MQRQLYAAGGAARAATDWLARHRRTPAILCGFAVGIAVWAAAHSFVSSFGFSREVIAGLLLATTVAFGIGGILSRRLKDDYGLPALLAAASLVCLPTLLHLATVCVSKTPIHWMEFEAFRIAILTLAALITFGLPAICLGRVCRQFSDEGHQHALGIGAAAGLWANSLLFAPAIGLQTPLLIVSVAIAIVWLVKFARGASTGVTASPAAVELILLRETLLPATSLLLIGIAVAVCSRSLAQLFPAAAYLVAAGVATFLLGAVTGRTIAIRLEEKTGSNATARRIGAAVAVIGVALPLAVFPWLVNRHLDADAFVSSVFLMMSIRMATVVAVILPLSLGCGLMASRCPAALSGGALAFGVAAGGWIIPLFGVVPMAMTTCGAILGVQFGSFRSPAPRTRFGWASAAVISATLVASMSQVGNYDPTRSAQLLFSTETFISHQRGVPKDLLPFLSDRRIVASSEEPRGTVTIWKSRSESYEVRVNGVPLAAVSRQTKVCPSPTGDVMSVAMPLVLHHSPSSLLILGDAIGVSTQVAAGFPLREIVCYDDSVGLRDSLTSRSVIAANDDRVRALQMEPRLAVLIEKRAFDVVVSDPGPPAILSNGPYFTREFYQSAAARLSVDGLFCQRLRYADFGVEPLKMIAATMRSVFDDVMMMEIGPGEYALFGVRPGGSVVHAGLAERLQRPHVRKTLASVGWDWCMPLNLLAVDQEGLKGLADEARGVNTNANARFAYTLPQEMMRWGPKARELAQGTANRTTRLLATAVSDDERRDIVDRIGEVTAQRELMVRYPDQPWAYRKEVRAKLVEAPRSVIRPVSGEVKRVRHPDDQHRLDYFEALGKAIGKTSPETLTKLESFAEPYDPFVTYFLHHEIAPLYGKRDSTGIAGELAHRLYAAYYADPRDRSVRDIATALELIAGHADAIPNEASRFDTLNSLIEVMLGRWEARGMAEPRSPEVAMIDIEKSLDATSTAIAEMDSIAQAAGLSDEEWQLRKAAIERTMTRPLRKYRTTLLPHLRVAQRKAAALAEKTDESTVE